MTTTEEKNKVLADFLGLTFNVNEFEAFSNSGFEWMAVSANIRFQDDDPHGVFGLNPYMFLEYHTSYDWIMAVVEKIGSMNHRVMFKTDEGQHYCEIWCYLDGVFNNEIACEEDDSGTLISAIYGACCDFAVWHNIYQDSQS